MLPARPNFASHAARESLWVWNPWFRMMMRWKISWNIAIEEVNEQLADVGQMY